MNASTNGNALARSYLQPIAAPSILGLYAFAGSTLIVAAELAGWYGNSDTALYLFPFATGALSSPQGLFPVLGFWFITLAWIPIMCTIAATAENAVLTAGLGTLALGSIFAAIAELLGSDAWTMIAGWTFIVSAVCAWYTASALMFEGVTGRAVLPVGQTRQAQQKPEVEVGVGEPGVAKGQ